MTFAASRIARSELKDDVASENSPWTLMHSNIVNNLYCTNAHIHMYHFYIHLYTQYICIQNLAGFGLEKIDECNGNYKMPDGPNMLVPW